MKQVYRECKSAEHGVVGYGTKELEVMAFETDRNDPELLPPLIHMYFFDRGQARLVDQWLVHDGLRGAEIIRKAIAVFDEAVAIHFPKQEGAE